MPPVDYVMADTGFTISDTLESIGTHIIIASFTKGNIFIYIVFIAFFNNFNLLIEKIPLLPN